MAVENNKSIGKGVRGWISADVSSPTGSHHFYNRKLVWLSFSLMLLGLIMVTSASFPISNRIYGWPFHFMTRHAVFLCLALFTAFVVVQIPIATWFKYSWMLLLGSFLLLIVVLLVGRSINGASRWIPLGLFNLQPAEIAKLSLFVYVSSYLSRRSVEVKTSFVKGFSRPLIIYTLLALLLLFQPDLGTVVVMLVTVCALLFIGGAKISHFASLVMAGIGAVVILILVAPYRIKRVTSFMSPFEDPFGNGYQLTQSLMAFGRGGWFGQGLGNSVQKLAYLPEAHTDFVFAVIAEEVGFIGVLLILLMIFALVYLALSIGKKALQSGDTFGGYLAISIGVWFAFQTLVNVGASAGIVPTKGLTLPLVSYGGSSLIIMTVSVAILLRIDYECRVKAFMKKENKLELEATTKKRKVSKTKMKAVAPVKSEENTAQ